MLIKKYLTLKKLFRGIDTNALFEVMKTKVDKRLDRSIHGWKEKWLKSVEAIQTIEPTHDPEILLSPIDVKPDDTRPCWISQLEGTRWENSIIRPLYVWPEVKCGNLEIAAFALWHLTFYGIIPEIQDKYFRESEREARDCLEEAKNKPLRSKRRKERKLKQQLITQYYRRRVIKQTFKH